MQKKLVFSIVAVAGIVIILIFATEVWSESKAKASRSYLESLNHCLRKKPLQNDGLERNSFPNHIKNGHVVTDEIRKFILDTVKNCHLDVAPKGFWEDPNRYVLIVDQNGEIQVKDTVRGGK